MLLERNENRKPRETTTTNPFPSLKNNKKPQKENKSKANTRTITLSKPRTALEPISTDPKKNFMITETNKIRVGNLKKILSNELSKCQNNFRDEILKNHSISADIRARMVS